jgi:hypothetical protein
MTVNEMHIAVNLGVQKIASFQADILLPQEIDFELNIAMMRFIKQRYNPSSNRQGKGFEQSQKRIDDLRNLVVTTSSNTISAGGFLNDALGTYIYNTSNTNIYVERATLPLDYLFLVSVSAEVDYVCNGNIAYAIAQDTVNYNWVKVNLTPPRQELVLKALAYSDGVGWVQILNTPTGQEVPRDELIKTSNYLHNFFPSYNANVVETLNDTGAALDPPVDSNHIYLGTTTNILPYPSTGGYIKATWQEPSLSFGAVYREEDNLLTYGVTRRLVQTTATPRPLKRISQCWFAQSDDIPTIMKDPFNRTSFDYIPYSIKENFVDVYSDNTFVVPKVFLVYIRKPKAISITSGIGCELAEHTHQEIVEMTIKSILEGIESQRYNSQSMENLESE